MCYTNKAVCQRLKMIHLLMYMLNANQIILKGPLLLTKNSKLKLQRRFCIMTFVTLMINRNIQMFSSTVQEDDGSWLARRIFLICECPLL